MSFDNHANFAYSLVATAPSPASSGTSLIVTAGTGTLFPTATFNAVVWPTGTNLPTSSNAEIVRVTVKSTDTFTITRAQESTNARTILVGDQIAVCPTVKCFTDIETVIAALVSPPGNTNQFLRGDSTPVFAYPTFLPITNTDVGVQNNWAPGVQGHTWINWNGASLATISGINNNSSPAGTIVTISNVSSGQIINFANNSGSSSVGFKLLNLATTLLVPVAQGGSISYQYNGTSWVQISHEQGSYVEFGPTSTVVGWSSTTVKSIRYKIIGKSAHILWDIEGTSNSTLTNFSLPFTSANIVGSTEVIGISTVTDNGTAQAGLGIARVLPNASTINIFKDGVGTAWTASGTKFVFGSLQVDIQ